VQQPEFFYREKVQIAVELDEISFPVPAQVKIEFSLTAQVNVTDFTAQRKVNKLLLDHVGNLLYGERPSLVAGRRLLWRVPVWLALPTTGPLGQVGALDVDAQTGEILSTQHILEEIAERGNALARRATPAAD
jgi:hypothetical protein